MNKSISLLAAAIVTLVVGLGLTTSSNAQSPMSDQDYCQSLLKALRESTGTVRGLRRSRCSSSSCATGTSPCRRGADAPGASSALAAKGFAAAADRRPGGEALSNQLKSSVSGKLTKVP
jgi:hypothetical protein